MREFGFFFFLSIAVAVSSTCRDHVSFHLDNSRQCKVTSFFSAPDASLLQEHFRHDSFKCHQTNTHFRLTLPLAGALLAKSGWADMVHRWTCSQLCGLGETKLWE